MVKKIAKDTRKFSLTNQLLLILLAIAACIFIIVAPFIETNVQSIVDKQLFTSIIDQQSLLIASSEGEIDSDEYFNMVSFDGNNLKVRHFIYNVRKNIASDLSYFSGETLQNLQLYIFNPCLAEMLAKDMTSGKFSQTLPNDEKIYFVITQSNLNKDVYWISFAYNDISSDLLGNIRNELVNVLYGVIIFIAFVLVLWIYTIIKPLHQIQNYIRAIKQGEKFNLNFSRKDEIGEVGEALKEMEAELDRQNKLQSDLIHNISHDLKTPIAIIRSYSECMKDDVYPYGDKNSSLDIVIENADRLEKKVKDFLYLNRLDYLEEKDVCLEEINVGEIASKLVNELRPLNEKIEFITDISDVVFVGEQEHWHSALMNILDNALRYADKIIKVTLKDDMIQIFNDGSYIDEDLKVEIFEPYTKGPKGNFGLGMSIVYKIVTMYHCDISVDNVEQGVVFTIKKKVSKPHGE